MGMRILVLGSGGREHALVKSLAASPLVDAIHTAPGNGGTALERDTVAVELPIEDPAAVAAYARDTGIDLVVIGPEAPLVAGVADAVRAAGIPAFGPGASGARVEGSKEFSKALMARHEIPAGRSKTFRAEEREAAYAAIEEFGAPVVIKADGLAAGKGVTVAMDLGTAKAAVDECFDGRFGDAGATVLVEEYLSGPECSLLAFVDGRTMVPMAPAQDHKRVGDGDTGPNTGGMGVYSPVPLVTGAEYSRMVEVMWMAADALADEGIEYRGVLYGGFVLTDEGPKLLEFNARFGDPGDPGRAPSAADRPRRGAARVRRGPARRDRAVVVEPRGRLGGAGERRLPRRLRDRQAHLGHRLGARDSRRDRVPRGHEGRGRHARHRWRARAQRDRDRTRLRDRDRERLRGGRPHRVRGRVLPARHRPAGARSPEPKRRGGSMLSERLLTSVMRGAISRQLSLDDTSIVSLPAPAEGKEYLLYVHVPFCERLCPYCSFNRFPFNQERATAYFKQLAPMRFRPHRVDREVARSASAASARHRAALDCLLAVARHLDSHPSASTTPSVP